MSNYNFGKYRIRESVWGFSIERRRLLFFWEQVGFEYTYQRARRKLMQMTIKKED